MGKTGEATEPSVIIACPTCGETYDSPVSARDLLRNMGYCVNITCLTDLSRLPLETVLAPERGGRRSLRP